VFVQSRSYLFERAHGWVHTASTTMPERLPIYEAPDLGSLMIHLLNKLPADDEQTGVRTPVHARRARAHARRGRHLRGAAARVRPRAAALVLRV